MIEKTGKDEIELAHTQLLVHPVEFYATMVLQYFNVPGYESVM